jgi:hypothetical protein
MPQTDHPDLRMSHSRYPEQLISAVAHTTPKTRSRQGPVAIPKASQEPIQNHVTNSCAFSLSNLTMEEGFYRIYLIFLFFEVRKDFGGWIFS